MNEQAPFPTVIEFEQNDKEGFGGPRNVKINGQRVIVKSLEVRWADQEYDEVTIVMQACKVHKIEKDSP